MTTTNEFAERLRRLISPESRLRPFVCDGHPLACEIFVVGINAATPMSTPFWHDWHATRGFDYAQWERAYLRERDGTASNTRQRLFAFTKAAAPRKVLETNLWPMATGKASQLRREDKDSTIFDFLVQTIRPKVIVTHGKPPGDHLRLHSAMLAPNAQVIHAERHAAYLSIGRAEELGREAAKGV